MDGNRFDDLTRAFSQRRSRRHLVKTLTGTIAGLAIGLTGRGTHRPFVGSDVNAQTPPPCVLTCPANVTQSNDPNQCGAVVTYPAPTTTGTCGTVTCSPASGSFFPVGTVPVMCTSTAGPTCSFTVTVNDTQPPVITCPADATVPNDPDLCGAVVTFLPPIATDNCPGVTTVCSPPSGSFFPVGSPTTVTCTATDAAANTASCQFTVTVEDTQPPTVTCPANITQNNDPGLCSAVVNYPAPGLSDNCPTVDYVCGPPSGSVFDVGTTTVTCNAIDFVNNPASCTFEVTVNDTENPTITCPADMVVDAAPGQDTAHVGYVVYGNDNCPGQAITCDIDTDSLFPVGTTAVTCSIVDAAGNGPVTCTFDVTVNSAAVASPTTVTSPTAAPNPTATNTSGVTTLPSTGAAPSGSSNDFERWGMLGVLSGAAAVFAARLRKSTKPADESSNSND
jgi:hypothetical protein